jgi:hypothetical protein
MELSAELFEGITGFTVAEAAAGLGVAEAPVDGPEPSLADRRRHRRFVFGSRAAISPLRRGLEGLDSTAVIRDISLAGVSLLYPEPLEVGDEFVIQFSGEFGWPARILCTVRRCETGGVCETSYVIGATFEVLIDACDNFVQSNNPALTGQNVAPGKSGLVVAGTSDGHAMNSPTPETSGKKSLWKSLKQRLLTIATAE